MGWELENGNGETIKICGLCACAIEEVIYVDQIDGKPVVECPKCGHRFIDSTLLPTDWFMTTASYSIPIEISDTAASVVPWEEPDK